MNICRLFSQITESKTSPLFKDIRFGWLGHMIFVPYSWEIMTFRLIFDMLIRYPIKYLQNFNNFAHLKNDE